MNGKTMVDLFLSVAIGAAGLYALVDTRSMPLQDRLFPAVAGGAVLISAVLYVVALLRRAGAGSAGPEEGEVADAFGPEHLRSVVMPVASLFVLTGLVWLLGHLIAIPLFVLGYCLWKREPWWVAALAASIMVALIFGLLVSVMNVALPAPLLAEWLPF
ncbi:tripartite tricarboxylate transporter TctB family protein [Salipiger sp.]|uniref:tripartite tricarboxylate transporter TctB family protein n=1 Tax=Salipiger sp. TaxID=2078585 RepID=UPI003A972643